MDWLKGMNQVVDYVEENLTRPMSYESLARVVGCSVYEFSRIFSFMAGMSVSEYIRRRKLSQAVFDIQRGGEKIIDIAMRYGYESPTTFARAFKELHGTTPSSAREAGVKLKTFPPISFALSIRGVSSMDFRIEKKDSFVIAGVPWLVEAGDGAASSSSAMDKKFLDGHFGSLPPVEGIPDGFEGAVITMGPEDDAVFMAAFKKNASEAQYKLALAFEYESQDGKTKAIMGQIKDTAQVNPSQEKPGQFSQSKIIPASAWAVFAFDLPRSNTAISGAYARILTEWLPTSRYKRDPALPHMELIPFGDDSQNRPWEIWMPVVTG